METVIFDLDNVIYDELDYFKEILKFFSIKKNLPLRLDIYLDQHLILNSKDIFGDVLKKAGIYDIKLQEELFYLYKTADVFIKPKEDVIYLIRILREMGLKIGLLTNGTIEAQKNKVKLLGIEDLFDCIVYARIFGKDKEKPHPLPFCYILSKLDSKPESSLMVGDNIHTDIIGAHRLGIRSVLYEGIVVTDQCKIDNLYVIRTKNILDILEILPKR